MELTIPKNKSSLVNNTILKILLLTFVFVAAMLYEGSLAVFVASVLWLIAGIIVIIVAFPKKEKKTSISILLVFFVVYYSFSFLSNILYVDNPYEDFFFHLDSIDFYSRIDYIIQRSASLRMYDSVLFEGRHWPGFATVSWGLGLLADYFNETNNITLQKTQIVFYCAMTIVFLYNTIKLFLSREKAFKLAVIFGLLSHILVFSGAYSRDTPIIMFFSMGFYIIMGKWSVRNLLILVFLGFLTVQFRFQHGISFLLLVGVYIFLRAKKIKDRVAYIILIIVLLAFGLLFVVLTINSYQRETVEKVETYQDYHQERYQESDGITSVIGKLPTVLQPLGNAVISQTYPYPPTRAVYVKAVNGNQWLKLPLMFSQIFWVFVWFIIIYGFLNKKYRKKIPEKLRYGLLAGVILIVAISIGSYENRRMLCAYPIIFLTSMSIFESIDLKQRKKVSYSFFFVYMSLLILYLFIKA